MILVQELTLPLGWGDDYIDEDERPRYIEDDIEGDKSNGKK